MTLPMLSGSQMKWVMMSSARLVSCLLLFRRYVFFPFLLPFLFLHMVILRCDADVQLALLLVVLLTPLIYLSQSILAALTTLLESAL